jgi:outer membrane protein TolC
MYRKAPQPMSRFLRASTALAAVLLAATPAHADATISVYRMLLQPDGGGGGTQPAQVAAPTLTDVIGQPKATTLPELLQLAVRQAPSLQRAEIDIEVALAQVEAARGLDDWTVGADLEVNTDFDDAHSAKLSGDISRLLPDGTVVGLNASSEYKRGRVPGDVTAITGTGTVVGNMFTVDNLEFVYGPERDTNAWTDIVTATVFTPLMEGRGRDVVRASERRARIARDAATLSQRQAAIAIVRDVVSAYWELAFAQRDLEIRLSSLQLAQERLRRTQAAIKGGGIAATEALAVEQVIAGREEEILGAELTVLDRSVEVRKLVNMEIGPNELSLSTPTELSAPDMKFDLNALIEDAYRTSPELALLATQEKNATIEVEVTENGVLPSLDLSLAFGPVGGGDSFGDAAKNLVTFDELAGGATLTFEHSIGNHAAKGAARQARAERLKIKIDEIDARSQIAQSLAQAVVLAESAARRIEIAGKAIALAEQNIIAEQSRFGLGKSTNFDVLQRQDELKQAQLRQARAIVDWHKAAAVISAISGDLLEKYGITLPERAK